jgi:pantetheine-phosphate adenylyltransferase
MPQKIIAVYPGSFDPPTLGHIDVIERAAKIFGQLHILVAKSSNKEGLFTPEERKKLLEQTIGHLKNVTVAIHGGLTVDYLKKIDAQVIIRGLRAVSDFEYELAMATVNRKLHPDVETFVVMADERFHYISSHLIKEVASHGGDLTQLVPPTVNEAVQKKLKKER